MFAMRSFIVYYINRRLGFMSIFDKEMYCQKLREYYLKNYGENEAI